MWGPSTYQYLKRGFPDCGRCTHASSANLRTTWGCDAAAARPVFDIGCSRCGGRDESCPLCAGVNRVQQYRCPSALLRDAPAATRVGVDLLMRAYIAYDTRHVLPVGGGLLEQTRSFMAACEIIDDERGRLQQMVQQQQEQDARAAKARQNRPANLRGRR